MRTLIAALTLAAVAASLASSQLFPLAVAARWLTAVAAPICIVTAAIYSRGRRQTFFLGAALAAVLAALHPPDVSLAGGYAWLLHAAGLVGAYALAGVLALLTRATIERRGWDRPESDRAGQGKN